MSLEVLSEAPPARLPKNVTFEAGPRWDISSREINVIGRRAEEACAEVDKFLDNAVLASVNRVRIVHGHGMGILRKALAELLATNPHVEKFYPRASERGRHGRHHRGVAGLRIGWRAKPRGKELLESHPRGMVSAKGTQFFGVCDTGPVSIMVPGGNDPSV